MNHPTKWVSALALSACLMTQYSYATNTTPLSNESSNTQETAEINLASLQDTLQNLKNLKLVPLLFIDKVKNTPVDKLKSFELILTQDQDLFDSWVNLILKTFPKNYPFDHSLTIAIEKGKQGLTPAAQNNLSIMYENGLGIDKDLVKAKQIYEAAADQGDALAQYNIGIIYQKGIGINKDLVKAREYLQKAADRGNAQAQYNLGLSYHYAPDNQKDLSKALYWYLKAAQEQHLEPVMARRVKNFIQNLVSFDTCILSLKEEKHIQKNKKI